MNYKTGKNRGFTLVELLLAMTFIAVLLLMITLLVMQVSAIYNKGLTLRAVNEAGQLLSSEMQRKLLAASTQSVIFTPDTNGTGGRLCAAGTVYAWNYTQDAPELLNRYPTPNENDRVGFIRFQGSAEEFCQGLADLPAKSEAIDLLNSNDEHLVIRNFSFTSSPLGEDPTQTIYQGSLVIGTNTEDLIDSNGQCRPPSEGGEEFCAVNEFTFTARTGSEEGQQ
jgi:prepilin-type N-terminal cleavage/methylation domain-containing protein